MKQIFQGLLLIALFVSLSAKAHDLPTIHYQVTETITVDSDLLVASIHIQFSGADAATASQKVNEASLKVIELTQASEAVTISSGNYRTWRSSRGEKKQRWSEWTVRQTLTMESQQFDQLLGKLAQIQQIGGAIQSLSYTISVNRKRALEEQLKVKAISRFRERAETYATAAGSRAGEWEIQSIHVDGHSPRPVTPVARSMLSMEAAQTVTAPAGTNTLSVSVNGSIVLTDSGLEEQFRSLKERVVEQLQ